MNAVTPPGMGDSLSMSSTAGELAARERLHAVRRVTWVGLILNLLLAALKAGAGIWGQSQALLADAVHTLSDMTTDVAILLGSRYWSRPPDDTHPHGHGRIETLVTAMIGLSLSGVGVGLGYRAVVALTTCTAGGASPGWIAFAAAVFSILSKETLFRWSHKIGERVGSGVLKANAWHHRSDALSSIPVALAVLGAALTPRLAFLDALGAVVVAVFILRAAWGIVMPALDTLADASPDPSWTGRITERVMGLDGIRDVHRIRTRSLGCGMAVDLHVLVDGNLSVREGHDIASAVQRLLLDGTGDVRDVVVHVEPAPAPGSVAVPGCEGEPASGEGDA